MNRRALDIVGPEVASGEQVRWVGMSSFRATALRSLPAFGLFCAIVPFSTEKAWPTDTAGWLRVAGIKAVFLVIGVIVVCRTLMDLSAVNRTAYAITDWRILIVRRPPSVRVRSILPTAINLIERRERPDGTGDVYYRVDDNDGGEPSEPVRTGFVGGQDVIGAVRAPGQLKAAVAA